MPDMPVNKNCQYKRHKKSSGQSLVETLVGFMLLIPIGLVSYDLTYILIACQNNEQLADNAARAAARHGDPVSAQKSVQLAIDDFQQTANYGNVSLTDFTYNDQNNGQIYLALKMDVNIPVVFASWRTMTVNAQSVQPIVGIPAPR
jgi:hypothetical protein